MNEQHFDGIATRRRFLQASSIALIGGTGMTVGTGSALANDRYGGWLDNTDNYDGTHDYRGVEEVRVVVGAGNGLLFDPAAILVDPGTTVIWEWSGDGGLHDVTSVDGPAEFASDLTDSAGTTFQFTFDDSHEGVTTYVCSPHDAVDMKGVVAVGIGDEIADDLVGGATGDTGLGGLGLSGVDTAIAMMGLAFVAVLLFLFNAMGKEGFADRPR